MPRVAIKKKEYKINDFCKWLKGEMRANDITQQQLGKALGLKQPAVSQRINNGEFTLEQLITIFNVLETDSDKIGMLLKM